MDPRRSAFRPRTDPPVSTFKNDTRGWKDPPSEMVWRPDGRTTHLKGSFSGQCAFLVGGGPSLRNVDLTPLNGRGIFTMAMNNAWCLLRPNAWVAVDPPEKFHSAGWADPAILKFVPGTYAQAHTRRREGDAFARWMPVRSHPNVVFFRRTNGFDPSTFFTEESAQWGTLKGTTDALGLTQNRTVMLAALKILHWMGFSSVFLLGVDFNMPISGSPYAFDEDKDAGGRRHNNSLYAVTTKRLAALKRWGDTHGARWPIYNCNPDSALRLYPFRSLSDAIDTATTHTRREGDTLGWYAKEEPRA